MRRKKDTGVTRKVDFMGRVVVPSEVRKNLNIQDNDALEIYKENDRIILKKYKPGCIFTGATDDLIEYNGEFVSKKAIREMAEIAGILNG